MRVVLDTNVVVSALITPAGVCRQVIRLIPHQKFTICVSDQIRDEYEAVLRRPAFSFIREEIEEILELIFWWAESVETWPLSIMLPGPSDVPFLEAAAAAKAVLITGNKRHFPDKLCRGVKVMTPREMLDLLGQ